MNFPLCLSLFYILQLGFDLVLGSYILNNLVYKTMLKARLTFNRFPIGCRFIYLFSFGAIVGTILLLLLLLLKV